MRDVNEVRLVGRLGADPKALGTAGNAVVLSVATGRSKKDAQGEWETVTTWHNVKVLGKSAVVVQETMLKGDRVLIQGSLVNNNWTKTDGTKVYDYEVIAFAVEKMVAVPKGVVAETNVATGVAANAASAEFTTDNFPF